MTPSLRGLAVAVALAWATQALAAEPGGFGDWAAVVVSGDDHAAHDDRRTEAFDNARRDVAKSFERLGIAPDNLAQISVHADGDEFARVQARLAALASRAPGGCLVYITSHGSPDGVVMGDRIVPPEQLARLVEGSCRNRPTAVIVSACFSGHFIPALAAAIGPRGYVFTAARKDRSSFGCGEGDRYPFFDGCILQTLPQARGFVDLADRVRSCVRDREDEQGMRPRSEPQLFVGADFPLTAPAFGAPG